MRQGIGIDFGTTNSTVALYDGERVRYLPLEAVVGGEVMPTALYLSRERQASVGRAAIDRYTRDNNGRTVRLSAGVVGAIEVTVAGTVDTDTNIERFGGAITNCFDVHAWTDQELPGRLFRSMKRWLGSATIDRVRVFDASYRIEALATPVLARMGEAIAEGAAGAGRRSTSVGRSATKDAPRTRVRSLSRA